MAQTTGEDENYRGLLVHFFWHESETFHQRTDWFLIFHAILFEAFFAAKAWQCLVIGALGFCISLLWLIVGIRQVRHITFLRDCINDPIIMDGQTAVFFKKLLWQRNEGMGGLLRSIRATPTFCVVIPALFLLAWGLLLFTIEGFYRGWLILAPLSAAVVACVVSRALKNYPTIDPTLLEPLREVARRPKETDH